MATATAKRPKKAGRQIPLVEDAFPDIPDEATDVAEKYVRKLRIRMKAQEEEGVLRTELLELMHKHSLDRIPHPDDDQKYLALESGEKIVTKKRKKTQSDASED